MVSEKCLVKTYLEISIGQQLIQDCQVSDPIEGWFTPLVGFAATIGSTLK